MNERQKGIHIVFKEKRKFQNEEFAFFLFFKFSQTLNLVKLDLDCSLYDCLYKLSCALLSVQTVICTEWDQSVIR